MKEQDYINATNLTKCRIAINTLRDTMFDEGGIDDQLNKICTMTIYKIIERLEAAVDSDETNKYILLDPDNAPRTAISTDGTERFTLNSDNYWVSDSTGKIL